jgi:hypothetical protein
VLAESTIQNTLRTATFGDGKTFTDISSLKDAWPWLKEGLFGTLFPQQTYSDGSEWSAEDKEYVLMYNKIVAGIRLFQQRVQVNASTCVESKRFTEFYPQCWDALQPGVNDDENPFGPSYDPVRSFKMHAITVS